MLAYVKYQDETVTYLLQNNAIPLTKENFINLIRFNGSFVKQLKELRKLKNILGKRKK